MSSAPRLVASDPRDDDADATLRPQRLTEFIGQQQARANLNVFIEAARARKEAHRRRSPAGMECAERSPGDFHGRVRAIRVPAE